MWNKEGIATRQWNPGYNCTYWAPPRIIRDGHPLAALTSAKTKALLFYPAVTGRPHTRGPLAGRRRPAPGDVPFQQLRAFDEEDAHLFFGRETLVKRLLARLEIGELIPAPEAAPLVHRVLDVLADARLITMGDDGVEVAHEALIREWPSLR